MVSHSPPPRPKKKGRASGGSPNLKNWRVFRLLVFDFNGSRFPAESQQRQTQNSRAQEPDGTGEGYRRGAGKGDVGGGAGHHLIAASVAAQLEVEAVPQAGSIKVGREGYIDQLGGNVVGEGNPAHRGSAQIVGPGFDQHIRNLETGLVISASVNPTAVAPEKRRIVLGVDP